MKFTVSVLFATVLSSITVLSCALVDDPAKANSYIVGVLLAHLVGLGIALGTVVYQTPPRRHW